MTTAKEELLRVVESLDEGQAEKLLRAAQKVKGIKQKDRKWPGTSLLKLAGAFEGPPDLSERHDHYLAGEPNG
ncbi:MAG: hypothetical protein H5U02_01755 [Clostridia bacterium]|nr:hypothetical protein [Clostridia bacterium]